MEQASLAPDFWDNPSAAERHLRETSAVKSWVVAYDLLAAQGADVEIMPEFVRGGAMDESELDEAFAVLITAIEELEMRNMLRGEEDRLGAIMDINSGAGGTESLDWANMLLRMYTRWCERKGFKLKVLDYQAGDEVGVKSVTLEIDGELAYGLLKGETGVHRLVRPSPFNAGNKRQTTFASVFVSPAVDDDIEITIDKSKISWDTFRSSGAGGQNVNKVESGVRLRYRYTDPDTGVEQEILIENTETRDQPKNRENALRILRSKLYRMELDRKMAARNELEKSKKKIEWGSQIRSYVLDDRRIKDHRTGHQTSDVESVLDGDLDAFIKTFLMEFGADL